MKTASKVSKKVLAEQAKIDGVNKMGYRPVSPEPMVINGKKWEPYRRMGRGN